MARSQTTHEPPAPDDSEPGGESLTPLDVQRSLAGVATRPRFVSEGVRQELLAGGRAFDYATGRELTLEGATEPTADGPGNAGTVRFKTEAEIAADPPPGTITTTDVAALNPS